MGSRTNRQHRFFFLTGSARTGKSFIIHQFKLFLEHSKRKTPTGVATQNVFHNFDFLSLNIPQTTTTQQPPRTIPNSTTSSQKRSLIYESLFQKTPTPPNQSRKRNRSDNSTLEKSISPNKHNKY
ncbi:1325_t:CDS:1 [Gigaspora rosea]|nr:1325_t:CDS:1 [Gigaspora rosea]